MKEETVFISSQEEEQVVKEEINNKAQEVSGKSKKNVEKMKKRFEKENKIQNTKEPEPEIVKEPEPEIVKEPEPEIVKEPEPEIVKDPEPQVIKEPEPEVKLEEIKIEDTKEVSTVEVDLSSNNILPDFSNKSITEIFLYIKQKYEDSKKDKLDNEINEIINYYTKINCVLKYNDIVIINKLLKSNSTIFDEIEKLAQDIIKNGDIESKSVPDFVIIIQILYRSFLTLKGSKLDSKKISTTCVTIIKFIFHSLLDKQKTYVLNLVHLDQLIESFVSLLDYKTYVTPKSCCSIM
jgi:hypothetical protein